MVNYRIKIGYQRDKREKDQGVDSINGNAKDCKSLRCKFDSYSTLKRWKKRTKGEGRRSIAQW